MYKIKPNNIADISSNENEIVGDDVKLFLSAMQEEGLIEYTDENGKKLSRSKISDSLETEADYVQLTSKGVLTVISGYEKWKEIHSGPVDKLALQISEFVKRIEKK